MKAGALPIWVSSLLVCTLVGYALLLVLVQFLVLVGSFGFSAFSIVSGGTGGTLGGVPFSVISRSGTTCGICTFPFFSCSSVMLITALLA